MTSYRCVCKATMDMLDWTVVAVELLFSTILTTSTAFHEQETPTTSYKTWTSWWAIMSSVWVHGPTAMIPTTPWFTSSFTIRSHARRTTTACVKIVPSSNPEAQAVGVLAKYINQGGKVVLIWVAINPGWPSWNMSLEVFFCSHLSSCLRVFCLLTDDDVVQWWWENIVRRRRRKERRAKTQARNHDPAPKSDLRAEVATNLRVSSPRGRNDLTHCVQVSQMTLLCSSDRWHCIFCWSKRRKWIFSHRYSK